IPHYYHHRLFSVRPPPPSSPLFPYTTLFRSCGYAHVVVCAARGARRLRDRRAHDRLGSVASTLGRHRRETGLAPARVFRHPGWGLEEHTAETQSLHKLGCCLLLRNKKTTHST